jgi:OmpA-OmpF porin, OOP family
MKTRLLLLLLIFPLALVAQVQYSTPEPRVDDVNDKEVTIRRVDLTDQYTVIYMTFQKAKQKQAKKPPFRLPFPNQGQEEITTNTINFESEARLYANDGAQSFKFIRAENIPIDKRRDVAPGERVDFAVYFERITPGIDMFDLFECSDRNRPGSVCFNFWGVHITNPPLRQPQSRPKSQPPVVTQKPRYEPRTTPGIPAPKQPTPDEEPIPAPSSASVKGVIRDAKTKKPMAATVTYQLLAGAEANGDQPADSTRSDKQTGTYAIASEPLSKYAVTISAKGYFTRQDTVNVVRTDVARNYDLTPIETGAKVTLKNIYFNASKYDLKAESFPELDRLVTLLTQNPTMQIKLEGHTDIVGDFDANVELSRNRVNAVKRYVVGKGIASGRIETVGYGPSRPINTNKSLKERPENRRVELVITQV